MSNPVIEHLARGKYGFLRGDPVEIRTILPGVDDILPRPQLIFLEDEDAPPITGFPILVTNKQRALEEVLVDYLRAEEEAQCAYHKRQPFDSRAYASRWERYLQALARVLENVTFSSHGGDYPAIFWLHHSLSVARYLHELPRRLRRQDLTLGRDHGDEIKYKIFSKWAERVVALNRETAARLSAEMDEVAEALFPELLTLMCDNVLILTEDYVSPDLNELASYFNGWLKQDGRELRQRLTQLDEWHRKNLHNDPVLRSAVTHLTGGDPDDEHGAFLTRPGYLPFLSQHVTYSASQFLSPQQIEVWEDLLGHIKRFELLSALRKMLVPLESEAGALVSRDRGLNAGLVGRPTEELRISVATRPMDFMSTWVVDPVVQRYGLVYDITDFSATLSRLGRAEKRALESAFRMTSSFQRRVNKLASSLALRLEKYLGDGAFYSGRSARHMLVVAIHLQRLYPQYLERGFPFDSGLRIALNFGEYRLLPLVGSSWGSKDVRYEFFGEGLVELSRLSTGKRTQEIDDFKTYLIAQGYPEHVVNKFFAPMMAKSAELVSKSDEARRFFAYINSNGALINEGIVATETFVSLLGDFEELRYVRAAGHGYIVLELEEGAVDPLLIGIRKLGVGKFKGLEPVPVYEVIDGDGWDPTQLKEIPKQKLMAALERLFASTVTGKGTTTT